MSALRNTLIAVSLISLVAACHSAPGTGPLATSRRERDRSTFGARSSLVIAEELLPLADGPLDRALRQVRPEFLRARMIRPGEANRPIIYVDNKYAGTADVLNTIPVVVVSQVEFLTPAVAKSRYGSWCECAAGVLAVTTRPRE